MTHDGRWVYHWNADNRLYAMETRPDLPATLPRQRLQFTYDHAGRRVRKQVLDWDPATSSYTPTTDTWFLWHNWQTLAEGEFQSSPLNTENFQLKTSFTWGHDLTGTFEGAGTIGGLLATHNHQLSTNHFPTYDGNGNLVAAIDAATGEPAARFTYSPFGETLTASGPAADQINFRFSTKYTDPETGLLYYGYRYYEPLTGTWLNRDPIEEAGGINLYGFAGNDGVGAWDYLGLTELTFAYITKIETATITDPVFGRIFNGGMKTAQTVSIDTESCTISQHFMSIGLTIEYDASGAEIDRGRSSGGSIRASASRGLFRRNICTLRMRGNEGNPLVFGAPGITYSVEIKIDTCKREYDWEVEHDRFPSHELWGHAGTTLHSFSHVTAGTSLWSLLPMAPNEKNSGNENY